MGFTDLTKQMLPAVENTLKDSVNQQIPERYEGVHEMMVYHLGWENNGNESTVQGKRIRPLMVLLSTALFQPDWKVALPAAAAVELLHNFSLIHDDIEDHSELRRGRKTLWRIWGVPQAINTGDAMFTLSQVSLLNLANFVSAQITLESMQLFNKTCIELTGGQYLDMSFETQDTISTESYFHMISGKTAALLSASAELGAIISDTKPNNRSALRNFGSSLGLAFQIWDDWLGIWGDESQTGKSASSDLLNGKKTLPVLFALSQKKDFFRLVNQKGFILEESQIPQMMDCLQNDGAKVYTEQLAREYTSIAIQSIESLSDVDTDVKTSYLEMTNQLLKRKN
ncbi:MAG: polyprenyl synthetase [Anaerolineaceae bacterium]|nr:polyprenyl synthetase [Anaerolineaceae bacterium]